MHSGVQPRVLGPVERSTLYHPAGKSAASAEIRVGRISPYDAASDTTISRCWGRRRCSLSHASPRINETAEFPSNRGERQRSAKNRHLNFARYERRRTGLSWSRPHRKCRSACAQYGRSFDTHLSLDFTRSLISPATGLVAPRPTS